MKQLRQTSWGKTNLFALIHDKFQLNNNVNIKINFNSSSTSKSNFNSIKGIKNINNINSSNNININNNNKNLDILFLCSWRIKKLENNHFNLFWWKFWRICHFRDAFLLLLSNQRKIWHWNWMNESFLISTFWYHLDLHQTLDIYGKRIAIQKPHV